MDRSATTAQNVRWTAARIIQAWNAARGERAASHTAAPIAPNAPSNKSMRKVARNATIISTLIQVAFWGGLYVWGKKAERAIENEIDEHENTNP